MKSPFVRDPESEFSTTFATQNHGEMDCVFFLRKNLYFLPALTAALVTLPPAFSDLATDSAEGC
jgi:hypothetical protein